jgi:hypothetical protein
LKRIYDSNDAWFLWGYKIGICTLEFFRVSYEHEVVYLYIAWSSSIFIDIYKMEIYCVTLYVYFYWKFYAVHFRNLNELFLYYRKSQTALAFACFNIAQRSIIGWIWLQPLHRLGNGSYLIELASWSELFIFSLPEIERSAR